MSTIFCWFEDLYDGVLWAKTWRAAAPPYPGFRWSKIFSSENFENFQAQKIFEGRWVEKKVFSRKDAYWVTWLHMKRLGHRACTTWATAAEIAKKRDLAIFDLTRKSVFGPFWVRGASERDGYIPLQYLRVTPKTSKVIQIQKCRIFFVRSRYGNLLLSEASGCLL